VTTGTDTSAEASDATVSQSVRDAEAALAKAVVALEEATRAQREHELAARRAAEEQAKVRKEFMRATVRRVQKLESRLAAAHQDTAKARRIAPLPLRRMARNYLRGVLQADDGGDSREQALANHDDAARAWLDLAFDAAKVLGRLTDPTIHAGLDNADGFVERVDAVEITSWRGFITRVTQLAGE
jgi:hypothetical protein